VKRRDTTAKKSICDWDETHYPPEHSTSSLHPLKPIPGHTYCGHGHPSSFLVGPATKWQIRGWEWSWKGGEGTRHTEERWKCGKTGEGGSRSRTQGLRRFSTQGCRTQWLIHGVASRGVFREGSFRISIQGIQLGHW